ncbi:MAG: hypothetical protein WBM41_09240 [Arenicellales bacterium]
MSESNPPEWIFEGLEEPEPGQLVAPALKRARVSIAAREVVEFCIGNLFSAFLVLLAPLFKFAAESAVKLNDRDNSN